MAAALDSPEAFHMSLEALDEQFTERVPDLLVQFAEAERLLNRAGETLVAVATGDVDP